MSKPHLELLRGETASSGNGVEPLAVSTSEAARLLGISRPTLYRHLHSPGFPAFTIGGRTLVSVEGLRRWVAERVES